MTILAAGASASVSLPAGQFIQVTGGSGTAVVQNMPGAVPIQLDGDTKIGPFDVARVVGLSAMTALDYTATDGVKVGLPTAIATSLTSLSAYVRKNSRQGSRFAGGTTPGLTTQSINTRICRFEAEAPFRRVRFHFFNVDTAAATGVIKFAAAATDTLSEASATLRSQPHRNGTAYAVSAADGATPGWLAGAFAGSASAAIPIAASTYRHGVLSSDWMDISSVPRTDVVGGRPALLMRVYGDIKWSTMGNITTDAGGLVTAWRNNQSAPWYRVYDFASYAGDGVTDLTQIGGSISAVGLHCAVEYDYDVPGLSVLGIGDSLTENPFERAKYAPWGRVACAAVSTPSCPVSWMNCGHSGQTAETFDPPGLDMIALLKPTHILHQAFSPNPSSTEATDVRQKLSMSRLNRTLAAARDVGARVVVWTPLANNAWDASKDAGRLALRQMLISRSAAGVFVVIDMEGAIMDGATPARMRGEFNLDGTHMNAAGMDVMAGLLAGYLRQFV